MKKIYNLLFLSLMINVVIIVSGCTGKSLSENETTIQAEREEVTDQKEEISRDTEKSDSTKNTDKTDDKKETGSTGNSEKTDVTDEIDKNEETQEIKNDVDKNTDNLDNVTLDEKIYGLSNEPVIWGVGAQVLEDNRPIEPVNIQQKYGEQYAIDAIKENEKKIYLTFDEGYENGYTGKILDTLKEKNVSAVFFVTMPYVKNEPELIRRMIEEGHVVGAHSVNHPSGGMPSLSADEQLREYTELHKYVKESFGYTMWLFRPPTGAFSEQSLAIAEKCGYKTVLWSFAYRDWLTDDQPDVASSLENAVTKLHNGAIYLLHAVSSTNTAMLGDFIDRTRNAGYEFCKYE